MKNKFIKLLSIITLIIYLEPQIFKENSFSGVDVVDNIYKFLKITCFLFVLYYYFFKNKKITKLFILVCTLQFILFFSTMINEGDFFRFIGPSITTIIMVMLAEILIKKSLLITCLEKINIYLRFCFIINLLSIVLIDFTPFSTFTDVYFLGIDNRFVFTFIPWVFFEGIVQYYKYKKLNLSWFLLVLGIELVLFYKFSVSAMLVFLLFLFVNLLSKLDLSKWKTMPFFVYLFLNLSIIIFKIQTIFKPFLHLFGKDVTFSGRTYIWDGVLKAGKHHWMVGHGMQSLLQDKQFFYNTTAPYYLEFCKVSHAHNSLMTLFYRGGILCVILFCIIIYQTFLHISKSQIKVLKNLAFVTICVILFLSLFDTIDFACLYFIITICFYLDCFQPKEIESKKIKIAYSVYSLQNGGIEQFIYNYTRLFTKEMFDIHIITQYPDYKQAELKFIDEKITIHKVVAKKDNFFLWFYQMCRIFKKEKFSILHSNMNETSFYILFLALLYGVKVRISHYHTALPIKPSMKVKLFKLLTEKVANVHLACGDLVGELAYSKKNLYQVIPNAIDIERFYFSQNQREKIRKSLHISEKTFVIGHIGRFSSEKNHTFILSLASKLKERKYKFILIGDGPLKEKMINISNQQGLADTILFLPPTDNIEAFYSAFDLFLLPSFYEGLPVVSIEAQCAGVPCIFSDKITKELNFFGQISFLPLQEDLWLKKIKSIRKEKNRFKNKKEMEKSSYNIKIASKELENMYLEMINNE